MLGLLFGVLVYVAAFAFIAAAIWDKMVIVNPRVMAAQAPPTVGRIAWRLKLFLKLVDADRASGRIKYRW